MAYSDIGDPNQTGAECCRIVSNTRGLEDYILCEGGGDLIVDSRHKIFFYLMLCYKQNLGITAFTNRSF